MRYTAVTIGITVALVVNVVARQPAAPPAGLAQPPATARHFLIQSTAGKHGNAYMWTTADGTRMGRESMNLRGQVWEIDGSGRSGTDGMPSSIAIHGVTPTGDAGETFSIANGTAAWKSPIDAG